MRANWPSGLSTTGRLLAVHETDIRPAMGLNPLATAEKLDLVHLTRSVTVSASSDGYRLTRIALLDPATVTVRQRPNAASMASIDRTQAPAPPKRDEHGLL